MSGVVTITYKDNTSNDVTVPAKHLSSTYSYDATIGERITQTPVTVTGANLGQTVVFV